MTLKNRTSFRLVMISATYIFLISGYESPIPDINFNIFLGTSPWYWDWHLPFREKEY